MSPNQYSWLDVITIRRAGVLLRPHLWFSNIKMTGLEVAILTHNDKHCGHVPCRPPSLTLWGCRCLLWWGKQHAIVIFRIKWVWIWLELSDTRVSSRGAFFGRIDYPRFQKKNKNTIAIGFLKLLTRIHRVATVAARENQEGQDKYWPRAS